MAGISNEEITEIRKKADIVEVIGSYINLAPQGKNYFGICPFHNDHSPSLSVSREKQIYKCFTCLASGNVFTFVQNYENISFIDICSTDVYIYANDCNDTLIATISIDNINSFVVGEYNQFTDIYEHEKDIVLFLKQWENNSLKDIAKSLMGV